MLFHPTQNVKILVGGVDEFNSAMTWITLTFVWHCAGALVIMLILMGLSRKRNPPRVIPPTPVPFLEQQNNDNDGQEQRSILSIPRCMLSSISSNCVDSLNKV